MTDIDLTEAVEEAAKSIMSEYEDGLPSWRDLDSQGQTWYRGIAKGALEAALPLILAQVEPRVTPSREDVARAIWDCTDLNRAVLEDCEEIADAVLALFNGKTEQEVRAEVAAEMDRLLESEWQSGWRAGYRDSERGSICGRRQAANEGRARGGEGR